jgi:hypothetical protein
MTTVKELKAELKTKGIKGFTGKTKQELMAMLEKKGSENEPAPKKACSCHDKKTKPVEKKIKPPKKITTPLQEKLAKEGHRSKTKTKSYE